jgi:phytoene dehydrogenase-like protein
VSATLDHPLATLRRTAKSVASGRSPTWRIVESRATPATTVRYTGNWRGSFEGFMPVPRYLMKGLPKRLPGLDDFSMVGQWVQPGGGLPTGVMTAREVLQLVCKREGVTFKTTAV